MNCNGDGDSGNDATVSDSYKQAKKIEAFMDKLILMPSSNRQDKAYKIIKIILNWIENNPKFTRLIDVINDELLPKSCNLISTMDCQEFDGLQEVLFNGCINDSCSFIATEFIADVYYFICKIAPKTVVDEYLDCYTKDEMPLKIKVFILPAIARSANRCKHQTNCDLICKFEIINSNCRKQNLKQEEILFIETFWKGITHTIPKLGEEWETVLAICLRMRHISKKLDDKLTTQILDSLKNLLNKCVYSQLVAATMLSTLKYTLGKTEKVVFKILRLYVTGESDDLVLSLLKYYMENTEVELRLEDYNSSNPMDLIDTIERDVRKLNSLNRQEKAKIRTIICFLQALMCRS